MDCTKSQQITILYKCVDIPSCGATPVAWLPCVILTFTSSEMENYREGMQVLTNLIRYQAFNDRHGT